MDAQEPASEQAASESREGIPYSGDVSDDQQQKREAVLRRLAEREGLRAQAQADAKARRLQSDPNLGPAAFDARFKALAAEARSILEQARALQEGSTERADARQKASALAAELDELCVRHAHELLARDLEVAQSQTSEIRREVENLARGRAGPSGAPGKKFGFQKKVSPAPLPAAAAAMSTPPLPTDAAAMPGGASGLCSALSPADSQVAATQLDAGDQATAGFAERRLEASHGPSSFLAAEGGRGDGVGEAQSIRKGEEAVEALQRTSSSQPPGDSQATGSSAKTVIEGKVGETFVLTPPSEEPPPEFLLLSLTDCSVTVKGVSASVHCRGLTKCHIELGPVLGAGHLTGLSQCSVNVCCHQLRLHECSDLKLLVRVGNRAIMEDCKGVSIGPYSMVYPQLEEDLERAHMKDENGLWKEPRDFSWLRQTPSPNWELIA